MRLTLEAVSVIRYHRAESVGHVFVILCLAGAPSNKAAGCNAMKMWRCWPAWQVMHSVRRANFGSPTGALFTVGLRYK